MSIEAIIVLGIILVSIVLFAIDRIPSDLVAICLIVGFILTGILTPKEAFSGFSNPATITVAFMFVLSHALLQSGSLQRMGPMLGVLFKKDFRLGMLCMILFVGVSSAFMNNTPIVAMFIPVVISIAHQSNISSSKLLIPLSYASILGGTCTLIGTSTNVLIGGIAADLGFDSFHIFSSTPIGLVFLLVGSVFLYFFSFRLLPDNKTSGTLKGSTRDYITEIRIMEGSELNQTTIMNSLFHSELEVDIIEIKRDHNVFSVPPGDFMLLAGDVLKIKASIDKIREIKDRFRVELTKTKLLINEYNMQKGNTSLLEIIISKGSDFESKTLKEVDFRGRFRAVPIAILHREEVIHDSLHDVKLSAGDIVLIEIKSHRLDVIRKDEMQRNSPFIILSEEGIIDFDRKKFLIVLSVLVAIVGLSAFQLVPVVASVSGGVAILVISRVIRMNEVHKSIDWRIVFLLAGALSIGAAMEKTGLAEDMAAGMVDWLLPYGPVFLIAGLYLITSICTELMSNTATAALFAPIAFSIATSADLNPMPFLITVMLAASASFMTPIGYQTNTMVYSAGRYKFGDFLRIGVWLNLILWLVAVLLIPVFYPF
ncbi:MAG: di/tricarboxylate transporter [Cyclobacteriaceae bacterium]|jgi:di/tricarboxylate transporter